MSNTGIKGITRVSDSTHTVYHVSVELPRGSEHIGYYDDIKEAARALYRRELEIDNQRKRAIY